MRLLGRLGHLFDRDRIEIGEKGFMLWPVFSWRENGLESDAERFVFQIREGFPNQQMSDS
jgi:hypothetical protein